MRKVPLDYFGEDFRARPRRRRSLIFIEVAFQIWMILGSLWVLVVLMVPWPDPLVRFWIVSATIAVGVAFYFWVCWLAGE